MIAALGGEGDEGPLRARRQVADGQYRSGRSGKAQGEGGREKHQSIVVYNFPVPDIPESTGVETYSKPSAGVGLLFLALATICLFLAGFVYLVGDRNQASPGLMWPLLGGIGVLLLVFAYTGNRMGNLAKFEIERDRITEFDKRGTEVQTLRWADVQSFAPNRETFGYPPVWMLLKGGGVEMKTPIQSGGAPLLTCSILSHLPESVSLTDVQRAREIEGRLGPSAGTRVYGHMGMLAWVFLILGAGILSVLAMFESRPPNANPLALAWVPLLFLSLGIPGLVATVNDKLIFDDEGITHIDWRRREAERIEWTDVKAFLYQRRQSGKGGTTYYYALVGSRQYIALDSLITKWGRLQEDILSRLPPDAWVFLGR